MIKRCKDCERNISRQATRCTSCHNKKREVSQEFRNKASRNNAHYWRGKQFSDNTKNKIREARAKQVFPLKDTSIEIKIQNFLRQLDLQFYTHQYVKEIEHGYQCDIFIPEQEGIIQKTIIECDGDYWHGNPLKFPNLNKMQNEQIEEDACRNEELRTAGFTVIRLWESEINKIQLKELFDRIMRVHKIISQSTLRKES